MGKNWDYSELAHNAKINGGPEKYLELIKDQSHRTGKLEGKAEGKTEVLIAEGITLGLGALAYAGYKAYHSISEKRERDAIKKREKLAKEAEEKLIKGIKNELKETAEKNVSDNDGKGDDNSDEK